MNKQEVIKAIEGHLDEKCDEALFGHKQGCDFCMSLIEQIDEPEKPVVPQFVAEYLKMRKEDYAIGGLGAAITQALCSEIKPEIAKWMNNNVETFARAWLDGYTVEKEQLYYVKVGNLVFVDWEDSFVAKLATTDSLEWTNYAHKIPTKDGANNIAKIIGGEIVPVEEEAE